LKEIRKPLSFKLTPLFSFAVNHDRNLFGLVNGSSKKRLQAASMWAFQFVPCSYDISDTNTHEVAAIIRSPSHICLLSCFLYSICHVFFHAHTPTVAHKDVCVVQRWSHTCGKSWQWENW